MLVVGDKESAEGTVSVRSRAGGDLGPDNVDEFVRKARLEESSKGKIAVELKNVPAM
jgi:threonyl-tRNA synthetase